MACHSCYGNRLNAAHHWPGGSLCGGLLWCAVFSLCKYAQTQQLRFKFKATSLFCVMVINVTFSCFNCSNTCNENEPCVVSGKYNYI